MTCNEWIGLNIEVYFQFFDIFLRRKVATSVCIILIFRWVLSPGLNCMDSLVINQMNFSYSSRYSYMQISVYSWLVEIEKGKAKLCACKQPNKHAKYIYSTTLLKAYPWSDGINNEILRY